MKTITGDLIKYAQNGKFDVIIHGCNCFCKMGGGIALQLSKLYPIVLITDQTTLVGDTNKLGTFTSVKVNDGFVVVNAYTQYSYGSGLQVDYDAVKSCFKLIKEKFSGLRIGYPLIGAGLAGGDWNIISKIIDEELIDEDHTLVKWNN